MTFGNSGALAWFAILVAWLWARWMYRLWQSHMLRQWNHPRFTPKIRTYRSFWRLLTYDALLGLGIACLILASARPQWGHRNSPIQRKGLDGVIVLDVSRSMKQTDIQPSRWQRAILELHGFCKQLHGDRFAWINFSGDSGILAPLTNDYTALRQLAWSSPPGSFSETGSGLSEALLKAVRVLNSRKEQQTDRIIVLLSDGVPDSQSSNIGHIVRTLQKHNIRLFVVRLTSKDSNSTRSLYTLATQSQGSFIPIERAGFGLATIVQSMRSMRRKQMEQHSNKQPIERFPWFLGAGFVLLLGGRLWGEK